MTKYLTVFSLSALLLNCVQSQQYDEENTRLVGGPCEGCEAIFEYGDKELRPVDTLPDFSESGPKIKVSGTIFEADGKTPAKGVILYVYHTDQGGIYATRGGETGWGKHHGYIRGWVKTGDDGRYTFYTLKPGTYPSRAQPAHIHPTILEPNGKYYWLGSYFFDDDPLLSQKERNPPSPRGGSTGVLKLKQEGGLLVGERDFILGKNIPKYQ